MKTKNILLIIATGLLMSGCFIKSLYPFYTKKDIVYDPTLPGTYMDEDSSKWVIKQQMKWPIAPDNSYQVEIIDDEGGMGSFNVHMFRLNGQFYLDFYPSGKIGSNDIIEENIVLTHSLAKVTYSEATIKIQWFNEVWLEKLLNENKIRIRHEKIYDSDINSNSYLLTAPTEELQKFILKYGDDPMAFKSIWEEDPQKRDKEELTYNLKRISYEAN
jgi:hypothetical protein